MPTDKSNPDEFDLDAGLTTAEREVWGPLLDATYQIKPRPEFAQELEARLLANATQPTMQPQSQMAAQEQGWIGSIPFRGRRREPSRGFRLVFQGLALALVMVTVLWLSFLLSGGDRAAKPQESFVPAGKVRHLVISHSVADTVYPVGSATVYTNTTSRTEDVWLTNGKSHLLGKTSIDSPEMQRQYVWVEEDSVYDYTPGLFTGPRGDEIVREVYKYPYDPRHLELYVPNDMNYLLTMPDAVIVGEDTLDGRPVTMVESIAEKPEPLPPPDAGKENRQVFDYRLWVDKETGQVLQRQHTMTSIEGPRTGQVTIFTFRVVKNELLEATAFPPDFFTFKLPEGAKVLEKPPLFGPPLTPLAEASQPTPAPSIDTQMSLVEFVPTGKVRHVVISDTWSVKSLFPSGSKEAEQAANGQPPPTARTQHLWYANGPDHLLMRIEFAGEGWDGMLTLVAEDAVYTYDISNEGPEKIVEKRPYSDAWQRHYGPHPAVAPDWLERLGPHARKEVDFSFGARHVTRMESLSIKSASQAVPEPFSGPIPTPEVQSFNETRSIIEQKAWVDQQTNQFLRMDMTTTYISGQQSGEVETHTSKVILDELQDASELPPDFFEFKLPEGAKIVEKSYPTPSPMVEVTSSSGTPLPGSTVTIVSLATPPPMAYDTDGLPRMSIDAFKLLYDDPGKRPIILDVRQKKAYDEGHIKGAVSFPEAEVDARIGELSKDRLIVAYCQ
jgi:outer membrane lipoprotein-sorting protein